MGVIEYIETYGRMIQQRTHGRKRLAFQFGCSSINISMEDLKPGLHILSVFDGKTWMRERLIIRRDNG